MLRLLFTIIIISCSCSITPKGNYSRSKIDRPYALPDDIASFSVGAFNSTITLDNIVLSSLAKDANSVNYSMILLGLEQGISDNASWLYPLGFKYNFINTSKHSLGISFVTLFFINDASITYWYRLNQKWSLRPIVRSRQIDLLFIEQRKDTTGLEVLYQWRDNFAFSMLYQRGRYEAKSSLVQELISNDDELDSMLYGELSELQLELLYSLSNHWDLIGDISRETISFDEFDLVTTDFALTIKYLF